MSETMTALLEPVVETAPPGPVRAERAPRRVRVPGMGSLLLRGTTWWACYYVKGTEHRESARQPAEGFRDGSLADATRLLRKRVGEIEGQQYVSPDAKRLTFEELRDGALGDYTRKGSAPAPRRRIGFRISRGSSAGSGFPKSRPSA
jgi:hypothetical protein